MKRILSLTLILSLALTVSAQHQIATLKHNDSISVYYGSNAFVQAHATAVEGDIITLSSGLFTPPDTLNKAITIRGAGFTTDTLTGKEPTVINTTVRMRVPGNDQHHLTLEGIRFSDDLECRETTSHAEFLRCYFKEIDFARSYSTDSITHSTFINCIIRDGSYIYNSNIVNCAVVHSSTMKYNTFRNCVAFTSSVSVSVSDNLWQNCVLYISATATQSSITCYNCIGINTNTNVSDLFSSPVQNNCQNAGSSFSNIFKTFTYSGSSSELYVDETFELTDSVSSLYLGSDGTQVGMHGGSFPFSSRVGDQRIGRITVAGQSNSEGKLPVVIEVVSE